MNTLGILKFARRFKHFAKRMLQKSSPSAIIENPAPHLILIFGGRTQYWEKMGAPLFHEEPIFRSAIENCDKVIQGVCGMSILPAFTNDEEHFLGDNEAKIILTIAAIQLAMFDLLKSKNISPDAIMGVSVGEPVAAYAAGGLTIEEVFRVYAAATLITQLENREYITLFLFTDIKNAVELCESCPVWVAPVYDASPDNVLLYCKPEDVSSVINYFKTKEISCKKVFNELYWPFHTSRIKAHKGLIFQYIKNIEAKPLLMDYYSPTLGEIIPKHNFIPADHWYHLMFKPVLINQTVGKITNIENLFMFHIGPYFFLKNQIQETLLKLNKKVTLLESMNNTESGISTFQVALSKLAEVSVKNNLSSTDTYSQLESFSHNLNLSDPLFLNNPYPAFNYLRANSSVHFIPSNNAWLVLDYDDINYALKQPGLFSSKILSGFDYVLIGTDPPEHTLVRNLLQPAFSPRVFDELGHFASEKAHSLLKDLALEPEFDFVQQFSLPMAQAVIAHFLGIDDDGALELKHIMEENGHTYHMSYLPQMEVFFTNYLKQKENGSGDDVGSLVASFVKKGDLSFDQAVCLMRTLWIAGMTTTSMLLSSSVNFLLKNPHIGDELRADEKLIPKFIEECVRLEAPESELTRVTTQEVELAGKTIPEGSVVILSIRAANREPRYYPDPNVLSLTRPVKRNLSFGGGYHYCLGIGMARTEAQHVIKTVLEELPNLRFSKPDQPDVFFPSPHFRGLESLSVTNVN